MQRKTTIGTVDSIPSSRDGPAATENREMRHSAGADASLINIATFMPSHIALEVLTTKCCEVRSSRFNFIACLVMSRTQFESLGNKMHSTDEKNNNKNSDDEKNELARRR